MRSPSEELAALSSRRFLTLGGLLFIVSLVVAVAHVLYVVIARMDLTAKSAVQVHELRRVQDAHPDMLGEIRRLETKLDRLDEQLRRLEARFNDRRR